MLYTMKNNSVGHSLNMAKTLLKQENSRTEGSRWKEIELHDRLMQEKKDIEHKES